MVSYFFIIFCFRFLIHNWLSSEGICADCKTSSIISSLWIKYLSRPSAASSLHGSVYLFMAAWKVQKNRATVWNLFFFFFFVCSPQHFKVCSIVQWWVIQRKIIIANSQILQWQVIVRCCWQKWKQMSKQEINIPYLNMYRLFNMKIHKVLFNCWLLSGFKW